jgi:hypothetical protein
MKKGQVNMMETVAVLFIFFILIIFGLFFYYSFQKGNIQKEREELLMARAMETTSYCLELPELYCSKGEAEAEGHCFEVNKLKHAQTTINGNHQYYFDIFSFAKITVHQIYPQKINYIVYDYQPSAWTRREPTYFIVTLKEETSNIFANQEFYGLGYLKVEVYS